jgi:hypothetical protein
LWRNVDRHGTKALGVACRLPDCSAVVHRGEGRGRRRKFCSNQHRVTFFRRAEALREALDDYERRLETPQTRAERSRLQSLIGWMTFVLEEHYSARK